jgi:shikimate kinase
MGAGKSTVGKRLARKIGKHFVDLDEAFEAKYRYSIPRFFDHFGEEHFREFEKQCLQEIIDKEEDVVISTGGGTACFHDNITLMNRSGITVYLKMHPKSLAQRLNRARRLRPVVREINNDGMQKFVEEQLTERETFYKQAQITIKGESIDMEELADKIAEHKTRDLRPET